MHQPEKWKPVPGYEGFYQASDQGRIRRVAPARGTRAGRRLKPTRRPSGYEYVCLSCNSEAERVRVHKLVAETFLGPCPPRHEVNHVNGVKHDNRAVNLEYVTHKKNMEHNRIVLDHGYRKLTAEEVHEIRTRVEAGAVQREVAEEFGIVQSSVSRIFRREAWAHLS